MIVYSTPARGLERPDPERRLVAAIIARTVRDLEKRGSAVARDAAAYVNSDNFWNDCTALGYDPAAARRALRPLMEAHHA